MLYKIKSVFVLIMNALCSIIYPDLTNRAYSPRSRGFSDDEYVVVHLDKKY